MAVMLCPALALTQETEEVLLSILNNQGQVVVGDFTPVSFKLLENGKERPITSVSLSIEPNVVAFLIDTSGSISHNVRDSSQNRIDWYKNAAREFVKYAGDGYEFIVMTFAEEVLSNSPVISKDKVNDVLSDDGFFKASTKPKTSLYSAMNTALLRLQEAPQKRKVLLVLTDGQDNASSPKVRKEVERILASTPITLLGYRALDPSVSPEEQGLGRVEEPQIAIMARSSGGEFEIFQSRKHADLVLGMAAVKLKTQYSLRYVPGDPKKSKKREIDVRFNLSKDELKNLGSPKLFFRKEFPPAQ